ncbi:hypothetical protein C9374_001801 [Naegleria lovaniensis]|uniref:GRF-type domain-containing protein n=1 Tax=Naegleria lovaniensis TaxID=51637 RepID=A0AA88GXG9_NAELO|nr:uncharacterized protein C9374_001801 [Naegleria lovaniensis]KAG2387469.1 hypothetical protein C9374_001801 [Naegleria lovaniensis]
MADSSIKTFQVLYTKQLLKKHPSYSDGFLKFNPETKAITLLDEKNSKLENTFLHYCEIPTIESGVEFQTKTFKIQVEDEIGGGKTNSSSANNNNNSSNSTTTSSSQSKPSSFTSAASVSKSSTSDVKTTTSKPATTTRSVTSTRKPFKPPLKENYESWNKNFGSGSKSSSATLSDDGGNDSGGARNTVAFSSNNRNNINSITQTKSNIKAIGNDHDDLDDLDFGEFDVPVHSTGATSRFFKGGNTSSSVHNNSKNSFNVSSRTNPSKSVVPAQNSDNSFDDDEVDDFDLNDLELHNDSSNVTHSTKNFLLNKQQNIKQTRSRYEPPPLDPEEKEELYDDTMLDVEEDENLSVPQTLKNSRTPQPTNITKQNIPSTKQNMLNNNTTNSKPTLDLVIDDEEFEEGLLSNSSSKHFQEPKKVETTASSGFQSASKVLQASSGTKPKVAPNLDLSLDNLDVDSDEDLKLESPPSKSSNQSVFRPPQPIKPTNTSQNSFTPPSTFSKQPPKVKKINFDDDDDEEPKESHTTPRQSQKFTPPQQFIRPSPPQSTPPSNEKSLTSKKFLETTKSSPNKKFKQTQLNMGQKPASSPASSPIATSDDIPILSLVQNVKRTKHEIIFPDVAMNDLFEQRNASPKRFVEVPDKFSSVEHYKTVFLDALYEEMNLQMLNLAMNFYKTYRKITQTSSTSFTPKTNNPLCHCKLQSKLAIVKKDGPNKGKPFYTCGKPNKSEQCKFFAWANNVHPSMVTNTKNGFIENKTGEYDRMAFFRRNTIYFYFGCEVLKQTFGSARKKNAITQWYLHIDSHKEKSQFYAKDDIWILSKSKDFQYKTGNLVIAKSVFHGPDKDGKIELSILSGIPENLENESIYAIRGPNFTSEFEMIENLNDLDPLKLPLLSDILGTTEEENLKIMRKRLNTKFKPPVASSSNSDTNEEPNITDTSNATTFEINMDMEEIQSIAKSFISEYKLNEDQANLIQRCAQWFYKGDTSSPICLVHGVYGSGKTTALMVLILFMCRVLDEADDQSIRILVASGTNVAVDNILEGLITENYKNLVRVGSQKKIAKAVLPYTVITETTSVKDQIKSLKDMLNNEAMDPEEEAGVKQAIKELQSGAHENRKQSVRDARVVGVTCAATGFEVLKGQKFSILILDESSQCLEPSALLPLARFGCLKFVAVGDPLQLPPTLTGTRTENPEHSLEKTIFIRLSNIGHEPLLLRTQYRCHPQISKITNELFYQNKLIDGITESDREPLIPGMPPVMVLDCEEGVEVSENTSIKNDLEAKVILHFIKLLLQNGIAPQDIGVIALYKLQERFLYSSIHAEAKAVKVSTVDAFQGGERNIILVSTSRTSEYGLSFIEQKQRLNVALSRARNHLVIVGKMSTLMKGTLWSKVINTAKTVKGAIWKSNVVLANNDFDFLSKFRDFYHPAFHPNSSRPRIMLDDDDDSSILDEELLPKNKHLEKFSKITHRRTSESSIITDHDEEEEYKFDDDDIEVSVAVPEDEESTNIPTKKPQAVEDEELEYHFSDDEEIDFNQADEIMNEMEQEFKAKRSLTDMKESDKNIDETAEENDTKKTKRDNDNEGNEIKNFTPLPNDSETDELANQDEKMSDISTFNEPLQTLDVSNTPLLVQFNNNQRTLLQEIPSITPQESTASSKEAPQASNDLDDDLAFLEELE